MVTAAGTFGERMVEIAIRCGAHVRRVDAEWGTPIDPAAVAKAIKDGPAPKVVTVVHAETEELYAIGEVTGTEVGDAYEATLKKATRKRILDKGLRPDGRATTEIRPISVQVGNMPRVHGSVLFTRSPAGRACLAMMTVSPASSVALLLGSWNTSQPRCQPPLTAHDVPVAEGHITARELRLMASLRVRCKAVINSLAEPVKRPESISELMAGTAIASRMLATARTTVNSSSVVPDCLISPPIPYLVGRR